MKDIIEDPLATVDHFYCVSWYGHWRYETDEWWAEFYSPRQQLIDNIFSTSSLIERIKKKGQVR